MIFTPCGGRPASRVIEVPSSVRLDPPPHPSWPHRRRTDAFVQKTDLAPWPAPGTARGPLAWSDEEHAAFIRDNNIIFPGPTPESEPQPEARLEALNEAIESGLIEVVIEAFESGAIRRKKPGRKQEALGARPTGRLRTQCLTKARGNARAAMTAFIDRVKKGMSKRALESGSADTTAERRWYAADGTAWAASPPRAAKIISAFNIKRRRFQQNSSL